MTVLGFVAVFGNTNRVGCVSKLLVNGIVNVRCGNGSFLITDLHDNASLFVIGAIDKANETNVILARHRFGIGLECEHFQICHVASLQCIGGHGASVGDRPIDAVRLTKERGQILCAVGAAKFHAVDINNTIGICKTGVYDSITIQTGSGDAAC